MNGKKKLARPEKKPAAAKAVSAPKKESGDNKPKKSYQLVRGMHDILPKEEKFWKKLYRATESVAEYFGFGRVETPILEEANLFVRSVGRGTDIVDKEMYVFEDRDGSRLAMRPEPTAGIMRAYIQHGLWNLAQPIKMWTWGPMFRHDRPQAGRYREFYQADFETLGAKDPSVDAELIVAAFSIYKDIGLPVEVRLNSVGTPSERARYLEELTSYYRQKRSYLCEDCRVRLTKNPLRLLDCKNPQCQPVKEEAPQILDWLDEESKKYFMKILEYLDEVGVPYTLAPFLVRGLDYYTGMVFEIYAEAAPSEEGQPNNETQQSALGGGGRYDLLAEDLGGKSSPAVGFGIGIERTLSALQEYQKRTNTAEPGQQFDAYFAALGEEAKRRGLKLLLELRGKGLNLTFNLPKGSLKAQLEAANSFKVPYVLILGQKEVQDETVIIRDMESGVQEIVGHKKLEATLKRKLGRA